jgi:argininosuccinate synthase
MPEKVVLAYSGGLDTSVAIKWLQEERGAEVVTLTLELGQQEDLEAVGAKAEALGVVRHYSIDVRDEFAQEYVARAIKANGLYEGKYPLSTALGRPLIAKKLVEVAEQEGADAVAHGSTGKGNDQVRFDVTVKALNPDLEVIAPVREWNWTRDQEMEYARRHGVPVEEKRSIFSIDQNLWGRSIESGPLEDPWVEPPAEAFEWVTPPDRAPDEPLYLELGFEAGIPVSLNGEAMRLVDLIGELNRLAGAHGVGIVDLMEDRVVGIKSREVYEVPAATCILEAHRELERLVLTRREQAFKARVEQEWAWLVYAGLWFEPLRFALEGFIDETQRRLEGKVRLKLYKGGLRVVGRSSPYSLYDRHLATYDISSTFDQRAAVGFIELWGLSSRVAYRLGFQREKR